METIDIECFGYSVKADIYKGSQKGAIQLWLLGRTSYRKKQRFMDFLSVLASTKGVTTVIFDYSGHGDSPFSIEHTSLARNFQEVITVFDWIKELYPDKKIFVNGSSYGGYLAAQLTEYREFDGLILRAPAIYRPRDFYTLKQNTDIEATKLFRRDRAALAKHPVFKSLSEFKGKSLLIIHGDDSIVPIETTDVYEVALNSEVYVSKNMPHSLDKANNKQIQEYNSKISDWLSQ